MRQTPYLIRIGRSEFIGEFRISVTRLYFCNWYIVMHIICGKLYLHLKRTSKPVVVLDDQECVWRHFRSTWDLELTSFKTKWNFQYIFKQFFLWKNCLNFRSITKIIFIKFAFSRIREIVHTDFKNIVLKETRSKLQKHFIHSNRFFFQLTSSRLFQGHIIYPPFFQQPLTIQSGPLYGSFFPLVCSPAL